MTSPVNQTLCKRAVSSAPELKYLPADHLDSSMVHARVLWFCCYALVRVPHVFFPGGTWAQLWELEKLIPSNYVTGVCYSSGSVPMLPESSCCDHGASHCPNSTKGRTKIRNVWWMGSSCLSVPFVLQSPKSGNASHSALPTQDAESKG